MFVGVRVEQPFGSGVSLGGCRFLEENKKTRTLGSSIGKITLGGIDDDDDDGDSTKTDLSRLSTKMKIRPLH